MKVKDVVPEQFACPICKEALFVPYVLGLVQCEICGGVFSPEICRPNTNEKMEQEWFGENYQTNSSFWVRWFEAWNNYKTISRISRAKPQGQRLLEIGVGSGSFLVAARVKGFEVIGCDLSEPICTHLRKAFKITMYCDSLATLEGESRFDVIVLNHVLEHVHYPIDFLEHVRRLLSPNGVVHIVVPNLACWEASLSGWTSFEPYHLTYFTPQTFKRTVFASGLTIVGLTTHESFSGWFLAVLRTAMGVNRESGAIARPANSLVGRAIGRRPEIVEHAYRLAMVCTGFFLLPARWLQGKLGFGDEVICIARKPLTGPEQKRTE